MIEQGSGFFAHPSHHQKFFLSFSKLFLLHKGKVATTFGSFQELLCVSHNVFDFIHTPTLTKQLEKRGAGCSFYSSGSVLDSQVPVIRNAVPTI